MKAPILRNPAQLCQLLNFVLELPDKVGTRTILRPAIDPCVVASWHSHDQANAEAWADARLRELSLGPREKPTARKYPGRPTGKFLPFNLVFWAPKRLGGAA